MNIDDIIDYVNEHYTESDISLKKLSQMFFYTEQYIGETFKKKTGMLFNDYILDLRLTLAKKLISDGETHVAEISRICGYKDPLYFSKIFSRACGISPTEAIKNQKNN